MIKLVNKGPEESLIEFRPRFKNKGKLMERKLLYGHQCDWCGNVIQALFLTDEEIRLFPYEETRVISQGDKNEGELLKIVPNSHDRESAYNVDVYRTKGGTAQLIRLKNHLLRWTGAGTGNNELFFEVGERCCKYVGVYTRNEAEVINEMSRLCNYDRAVYAKSKVNIPISFLAEWKPTYSWNQINYKVVPVIGRGTTMMMVPRHVFKNSGVVSGFIDLYDCWDKKVAQESKSAEAVEF